MGGGNVDGEKAFVWKRCCRNVRDLTVFFVNVRSFGFQPHPSILLFFSSRCLSCIRWFVCVRVCLSLCSVRILKASRSVERKCYDNLCTDFRVILL